MAINVRCDGCRKRFDVSEKFAGSNARCPNCKNRIFIPPIIGDAVYRARLRDREEKEKKRVYDEKERKRVYQETVNTLPEWRTNMKTIASLIIWLVIGSYAGFNLTTPTHDEANLHELARQTAENTRYIFILLFTALVTFVGMVISDNINS